MQAVSHMRLINGEIRAVGALREDELFEEAEAPGGPHRPASLCARARQTARRQLRCRRRGDARPTRRFMMQLGAEGVFVGSGIFKSGNPAERACAIVGAVTRCEDPEYIAHVSENLGEAMVGINKDEIELLMAERGI